MSGGEGRGQRAEAELLVLDTFALVLYAQEPSKEEASMGVLEVLTSALLRGVRLSRETNDERRSR